MLNIVCCLSFMLVTCLLLNCYVLDISIVVCSALRSDKMDMKCGSVSLGLNLSHILQFKSYTMKRVNTNQLN